jgi:hypothetical protein
MKTDDEILKEIDAKRAQRPGGFATRCGRCIYWEIEKREQCSNSHPEDWMGECHRHAPLPVQYLDHLVSELIGSIAWAVEERVGIEHSKYTFYRPSEVENAPHAQWAMTAAYKWCGDFSERPNADHDQAIQQFLESTRERKQHESEIQS